MNSSKGGRDQKKQGHKKKGTWNSKRKRPKRFTMGDDKEEKEDPRDDYKAQEIQLDCEQFDQYYQDQLDVLFEGATPEAKKAEYDEFVKTLKTKLPITFRVNPLMNNFELMTSTFCDPNFIEEWRAKAEATKTDKPDILSKEEKDACRIKNWDFYPEKLLHEMNVERHVFRKDPGMKAIHKYVQMGNDAGLLTRQEIVSMIPPLILGVEPGHKVLDTCAAPGSKTAQLLEFQLRNFAGKDIANNEGFVLANDADSARAKLLVHQTHRFNSGSIAIVNHNAVVFPKFDYIPGTDSYEMTKSTGGKAMFDRIVCDVPCSSDAAIRKIPRKWASWSLKDGATLHPLQLDILCRGIELLKPGGLLSYSTCSLNPIENESVVAACLKKFGDQIEIVESRSKLGSFRTREGLTSWKVCDDSGKIRRRDKKSGDKATENGTGLTFDDCFTTYENYEAVPHERYCMIKETMFMPETQEVLEKQNLKECLRVFPHDQDTSGFFIVLFRKKENAETEPAVDEPKPEKLVQSELKGTTRCDPADPDIEYIQSYYGLSKDFPLNQIFTYSDSMNKLQFVTKGLSDLLYADTKQQLELVAAGVEAFVRNQSKFGGAECIFRISQDGVYHIYPYMTKRVIKCSLDFMRFCVEKVRVEIPEIEDEAKKSELNDLPLGCFVLAAPLGDREELLVMHRHATQINFMLNQHNLHSIKVRIGLVK